MGGNPARAGAGAGAPECRSAHVLDGWLNQTIGRARSRKPASTRARTPTSHRALNI
jgi:hypothetical protein